MPLAPLIRSARPGPVDHAGQSSNARGYTSSFYRARRRWIAARLASDPSAAWCPVCGDLATVLDHIRPPASAGPPGSPAYERLHADEANWQLLCRACNSRKGQRIISLAQLRTELARTTHHNAQGQPYCVATNEPTIPAQAQQAGHSDDGASAGGIHQFGLINTVAIDVSL